MKRLFSALLLAPAIAGVAAGAANANGLSTEQLQKIDAVTPNGITSGQITSITELSDVKPTDWAYQALQSLVERYGCIVGYPDRTYRGSRPLSRYEFAAGLNACLDKVIEFAASKEDLDTLKRLTEEFQAELATLRGRVDSLEARVKELEATRFSTTTKLQGEVIFSLDAVANTAGNERNQDGAVSFGNRVSLNLNTSFTGKDLLLTRLRARNIETIQQRLSPGFNPSGSRLDYDGTGSPGVPNSANTFFLDKLLYRFPVGDVSFTVGTGTAGVQPQDYGLSDATFFSGPANTKAFKYVGAGVYADTRDADTAGVGFNWKASKNFSFQAGYINRNSADVSTVNSGGVFGFTPTGTGTNSWDVNAQVKYQTDNNKFRVALAYALRNGPYATDFGTTNAFQPFGATNYNSNSLALSLGWAISDAVPLSAGYALALSEQGTSQNATVQNYAIGLTFPNLFADGNEFGVAAGQQPWVSSASNRSSEDTGSFGVETYYKFQVTDNISITPGIYVFNNTQWPAKRWNEYVPFLKTVFRF
uniref:SomA n=1 Tax=Synechococcus sp. (strain ATCC 27144 / PCC 6301 / SAUG 1402/1) TaxID=269084 RepID=O86994_SYNP6|nr:SomA [Synechococcus elongatus PCC 6301]